MKVQIEENLYIETDSMQFIVKQYKTSEKGNEYETIVGYFPTLESAVKKVSYMKVQESTATTLSELLTEVKGIREYIEFKINI